MVAEQDVFGRTDCMVVKLQGALDLRCAPWLWSRLVNGLRGYRCILVDLSRVTWIDSSAVASIVAAYRKANETGARFGLVGVNQQAMRMLDLCRLTSVLKVYANAVEGLRDMGQFDA